MADFQLSVAVRDAMNDAFEAAIGASSILKMRTGAKPANVAAADSGTVLSTVALPADWMAASVAGVKAKAGTWQDLLADAAGTVGHFRIYASDGVTCHAQGTVTATGGGGSMTVDNVIFAVNQPFNVTSFSITAGNA